MPRSSIDALSAAYSSASRSRSSPSCAKISSLRPVRSSLIQDGEAPSWDAISVPLYPSWRRLAMSERVAWLCGVSLLRSMCSWVRLVQLRMLSFGDACSGSAEDFAGAGVDGSAGEDAAGVAGEGVVSGGVIGCLQCTCVEEEFANPVFVLLVGDLHAPVAFGVVDDGGAEAEGVVDGAVVGFDDASVGVACCSDEDGGGGEPGRVVWGQAGGMVHAVVGWQLGEVTKVVETRRWMICF